MNVLMKKIKKWNKYIVILGIAGVAMILTALVLLLSIHLDYKGSEDTYADLQKNYVVIKKAEVSTKQEEKQTQNRSQKQDESQYGKPDESQNQNPNHNQNPNWWYENVNIDFAGLQAVNPEITGWILFDNIEGLSYPILYSGDNEKYLRRDIYGKSTTAGCIFMEGACTPDFEDCHTILYGHNMRNLSMFGSLKKFKTEDYYNAHQYFTIYTNDMAYRYRVFAYRDVAETDSVYSVGFAPNGTFQKFIDEMMLYSCQDAGITVSKEDKVMTLSTCSTEGHRFVVHAVRVDEHTYEKDG